MTWLAWIGLALLPAIPFTITTLNLLTWRRGQPTRAHGGGISALIPARDEEAQIERCVRALAAANLHEVIVYDDESRDRTLPILLRLQREIANLRVIIGGPLPEGRVGKPHACAQLAHAARAELLLFVDADTVLLPGGIERLLSLVQGAGAPADVVSAVPRQLMGSWSERLLMPLLHLTYTSWLPLFLVAATRDPRFTAANGQLLLVRRAVYRRLGGFEAVAHEIADDMAFCRRAKALGARVVFADGFLIARCRMYHSLRSLWRGFSKNLYEGMGERPGILLLVLALHVGAFVAPYAALGLSAAGLTPALWRPALVGVALNLLLRGALALRFRHPPLSVLLHPLAVLVLCALTLNSYRWSARGELRWAGRSYNKRAQRISVAT